MAAKLLWIMPLVPAVVGAVHALVARPPCAGGARRGRIVASSGAGARPRARGRSRRPAARSAIFRADDLGLVFLLLLGLLALAVSIATVGWMRQELARRPHARRPAALLLRARPRLHRHHAGHGAGRQPRHPVDRDGGHHHHLGRSGRAFHGDKHGLEAAWKYIIVTTIGISFGLFGTVLVYGAAVHAQGGVAGAMNWSSICRHRAASSTRASSASASSS